MTTVWLVALGVAAVLTLAEVVSVERAEKRGHWR